MDLCFCRLREAKIDVKKTSLILMNIYPFIRARITSSTGNGAWVSSGDCLMRSMASLIVIYGAFSKSSDSSSICSCPILLRVGRLALGERYGRGMRCRWPLYIQTYKKH
jgi:hypothetical protein